MASDTKNDMASVGCGCGCGETAKVTAAAPCECGCECCDAPATAQDERVELERLRASIDARLASLDA